MSLFERLDVSAWLKTEDGGRANLANTANSSRGLAVLAPLASTTVVPVGKEIDFEGYFYWDPLVRQRIRVKLPQIIEQCKVFGNILRAALVKTGCVGAFVFRKEHLTFEDSFSAVLRERQEEDIEYQTAKILLELESAISWKQDSETLIFFGINALAGQLAVDAGLLHWQRDLPLIAAYDYMEILMYVAQKESVK